MNKHEGKWYGSSDGEIFGGEPCDSAEEALANWDDDERPCVAVGQSFDLFVATGHAEGVLERIECLAADNCHPDLDCELDGVTAANRAELDECLAMVINAWAERHGVEFRSYGIRNTRKVVNGGLEPERPETK